MVVGVSLCPCVIIVWLCSGTVSLCRALQTGPKGVIKDWQRYKQLEAEKRASQSLEKMQLAKKLTLTCR